MSKTDHIKIGELVLVQAAVGHHLPSILDGVELPLKARVVRPAPGLNEAATDLWWVLPLPPFEGGGIRVHADQLRPGDGSCPECGSEAGIHNISCKLARTDREAASGKQPPSRFSTDQMLVMLTRKTVGENIGAISILHEEDGGWLINAEYGQEMDEGEPTGMVGAATYGSGDSLRQALVIAGSDAGLWTRDDTLGEPDVRRKRVLIVEGEHSADLHLGMVGSMVDVADADEVFAFTRDKAIALKDRDDPPEVSVTIKRLTPEPTLKDAMKHIRSLAPHELSCKCSHRGEFDMSVHDSDCPRRQLEDVLAVVEERS